MCATVSGSIRVRILIWMRKAQAELEVYDSSSSATTSNGYTEIFLATAIAMYNWANRTGYVVAYCSLRITHHASYVKYTQTLLSLRYWYS